MTKETRFPINPEQAIEQARREYGAMRAGIGDASTRVLAIRRLIKIAKTGLEALDESHTRSAQEIENELRSAFDKAVSDYQKKWSSVALRNDKGSKDR